MERKELKQQAKQLLEKYKWFAFPMGVCVFLAFAASVAYMSYISYNIAQASRQYYELGTLGQALDSAPRYGAYQVKTNIMSTLSSTLVVVLSLLSIFVIKYDLKNWKELYSKITFKKIGRVILAELLVAVKTFLWALLLIIPGIIKSYEYSLVVPLIAVNDEMTFKEAFRQSKEKMTGYKLDLFILGLSFIGWILLGYILIGLPLIYVMPYYVFTITLFYIRRGV